MKTNPKWRRYLRFFGPDLEADIQDELSFHVETKVKELVSRGMSPEEARRQALQRFGDIKEVSQMCRQIDREVAHRRGIADWLSDLWRDIRTAVRGLRRAPNFSIVAILTLSAGIAGATGLFSLADSWIFRSVRFPDPDRLIFARSLNLRQGREISVSVADFRDLRERMANRLETPLAAWSWESFTLSVDAEPERIPGNRISENFLSTLRVQPVLGREFTAQEFEWGRHRVALVSHGFWKARLHADPGALGSTVQIDGEPYQIVGVMPESFHFTLAGRGNVLTPLALTPDEIASRQTRFLHLIGRMKQGDTVAGVRDALTAAASELANRYPDTNQQVGIFCISLHDETGRHTGESILWVIFAVSIGLLLIACSNVANLLLVRAQARQRESSIQVSLGAGKGRLLRGSLIETIILFLVAAAIGTVASKWLIQFSVNQIPFENRGFLPGYGEADLSVRVLLFSLGVSLFTGLVFGLAPAFESLRTDVIAILKESGSAVSQNRRSKRLRLVLVASQIALALVLVSSTLILVREFRKEWTQYPGFVSEGLLTFKISLNEKQYSDAARRRTFFSRVHESVGALREAAIVRFLPFSGDSGQTSVRVAGAGQLQPESQGRQPFPGAAYNAISPEYFTLMRTPLLAGRAFTAADAPPAPLVAIVNDAFVKHHLRDTQSNAIGRRVLISRLQNREAMIVGVAPEIREGPGRTSGYPQLYVPFAQAPGTEAHFVLRSDRSVFPEVRKRVAAMDPMQPVYQMRTMDENMDVQLAPFRVASGMLVWFGGLAMVLAAVGVYGMVAYSAAQRTRELGIRAALGAGRPTLMRLFLKQGFVMLQAGLIPGLLAGAGAGMALRSLLQDVTVQSPVLPLALTSGMLALAVLAAVFGPAWKATSTDPLKSLRYDG